MSVAVAVITDSQNKILITRRAYHVPHGGLWEFPGGKIKEGETPEQGLCREIKEEVGLQVHTYNSLGEVSYVYNNERIVLFIFHVTSFYGLAHCCEQQIDLQWIDYSDLEKFEFPKANHEIIKMIKDLFLGSVDNWLYGCK